MNTLVKEKVNEVVIEIDNTLEPIDPNPTRVPWGFKRDDESEEEALERHIEEMPREFNKSIIAKSTESNLVTVRDCIAGDHRHLGYLGYLALAWKNHYGVIFTPDIFWQLFLTEVAGYIKDNAETYRDLFTDSDEKKEIIVETGDPQLIDLNKIAEALLMLTPTNTKMFLPEFSTTTEGAALAFKAAFADAMSPYYDYSMLMCGIPRVKVLGEENDWNEVIKNIESFGEVIALPEYFEKVTGLAERIKENISEPDTEFWKDIFRLDRCGSGGQTEVRGWINDLLIDRLCNHLLLFLWLRTNSATVSCHVIREIQV